jgi:prevent-host-death family protein
MNTLTASVTTRDLRAGLSDILGRVTFGRERISVTKNGKPAAVLITVEDLEDLEALEMAADVAAYKQAAAKDDGTRVSLADLKAELGL